MIRIEKSRSIILIVFVCIIGIVFIIQLFNLQIVNGENYREQSERRLVREAVTYAPRGEIYDRYGKILATSVNGYSVQIYKTKIDTNTLNEVLLEVVRILEKNGDEYNNQIPIDIETGEFVESKSKINRFIKDNNLDENVTATDVLEYLKKKYKLEKDDMKDILKISALRYEITIN